MALRFFEKRDRDFDRDIALVGMQNDRRGGGEVTFPPSFLPSFVRSTLVERAVGSVKKGKKKEKGRKKTAGGCG